MRSPRSNFVFSQVPSVVRPRSKFDRSRYYKSTFDAGYLIPFFWDEVLPGDTFTVKTTSFARLATLIVPFMDNLFMDFFFFFVPNRLVWDNWERFCGAQDNPDDSTDYLIPQVTLSDGVSPNTLEDYFGLPLIDSEFSVSALPFRCYNLIWNEWFRDENLQDSLDVPTDDGPDSQSNYTLKRRGKRKSDPFTSALPWPQKGPGVELPIGDYANIGVLDTNSKFHQFGIFPSSNQQTYTSSGNALASRTEVSSQLHASGYTEGVADGYSIKNSDFGNAYASPLLADLTHATAVTINSMREAFQVQKWYEQLARGGSRYLELCLSMFGTHTGDARLQRPEYLGGGSTPIQIHSVVQSSGTMEPGIGTITPQGNLAGYGIAAQNGIGFTKSFVEHGHIIGLVSIRGDYGYQQGLDRMWSRKTKFDFYWPAFAHLGEVPVLNKEIYFQNNAEVDNAAFGYQERWYEYRYGVNKITGRLRRQAPDVPQLDYWHLAQYFESLPTLNNDFIVENPPVGRVLAVQDEPQFIFDSVIRCRCARVMPVYSVPGLVDHF